MLAILQPRMQQTYLSLHSSCAWPWHTQERSRRKWESKADNDDDVKDIKEVSHDNSVSVSKDELTDFRVETINI
jgi:hypothetical protein